MFRSGQDLQTGEDRRRVFVSIFCFPGLDTLVWRPLPDSDELTSTVLPLSVLAIEAMLAMYLLLIVCRSPS